MSTGNVFENVRMEFYPPLREGETEQERLDELQRKMHSGQPTWQPIETAPEGIEVLVVESVGGPVYCAINDCGFWRQQTGDHAPETLHGDFYVVDPTHWMPLPEPPEAQK